MDLSPFSVPFLVEPAENRGLSPFYPPVLPETPIPWLHIARVVAEEARRRELRRVGVLGTRYTMGGGAPIYRAALDVAGIETIVPEAADFGGVGDRPRFSSAIS